MDKKSIAGPAMSKQARSPLIVSPGGNRPLMVSPTRAKPLIVSPGRMWPEVIIPPKRAIWDDRGWEMKLEEGTTVYVGRYQVKDRRTGLKRSYAGRIRMTDTGVEAYILDPLPALYRKHPKRHCFQALSAEPNQPVWFKLHWLHAAKDPDTALLYMEQILFEAVNHYSDSQ
jgi:hypothetical protein